MQETCYMAYQITTQKSHIIHLTLWHWNLGTVSPGASVKVLRTGNGIIMAIPIRQQARMKRIYYFDCSLLLCSQPPYSPVNPLVGTTLSDQSQLNILPKSSKEGIKLYNNQLHNYLPRGKTLTKPGQLTVGLCFKP